MLVSGRVHLSNWWIFQPAMLGPIPECRPPVKNPYQENESSTPAPSIFDFRRTMLNFRSFFPHQSMRVFVFIIQSDSIQSHLFYNRILKGPGVVIPLIFPKGSPNFPARILRVPQLLPSLGHPTP